MNNNNDADVGNNADSHADSGYVSHADAVPEPASIPETPICNIVIYPKTNSVVAASPSPY